MERFAFIFPGQGSQTVGMGKDLYESYEEARFLYDAAEDILGFPLKHYSFEGPDDVLRQTYITQPALFVHSAVFIRLLHERDITPILAAGHSLGEYSALNASGAAQFSDLLRLVKIRGELMQTAGEKAPGTMAALIGVDEQTAAEICKEAGSEGIVQPANYNAPGQIVLSGSLDGMQRAMTIARKQGVRRIIELNVSAAFHSPLMADAIDGLVHQIHETQWQSANLPVVANVTARPMTEPLVIKQNLERQLLNPVRWSESVEFMSISGIDAFIEVGAGNVLQGLVKRIQNDIPCYSVGTVEDLETFIQCISEKSDMH